MFIMPVSLPFLAIIILLIVFGATVLPVIGPFMVIAFIGYVIYDNIRYRRQKKMKKETPVAPRPEFDAEPAGKAMNLQLSSVQATEKALRIVEIRDMMVLFDHDMPTPDLVTQTKTDHSTGIQTVTVTGALPQTGKAHVCKVRFDKDGNQLGEPTCTLIRS